jgi:hypothetical protein
MPRRRRWKRTSLTPHEASTLTGFVYLVRGGTSVKEALHKIGIKDPELQSIARASLTVRDKHWKSAR